MAYQINISIKIQYRPMKIYETLGIYISHGVVADDTKTSQELQYANEIIVNLIHHEDFLSH